MISVIIPAMNEKYLDKTMESIFTNFVSDSEIIIVENKPIREAINQGVSESKGEYILKIDPHCAFANGFDAELLKHIQDDEVVVARRYRLNIETWEPEPRAVDYYYLSCPWTYPRGSLMSQSCPWIKANDMDIDDLMCFQGSM